MNQYCKQFYTIFAVVTRSELVEIGQMGIQSLSYYVCTFMHMYMDH